MNENDVLTAPQLADVNSAFILWSLNNRGNRFDFYKFLTIPTLERDLFLESIGHVEISMNKANIAEATIVIEK